MTKKYLTSLLKTTCFCFSTIFSGSLLADSTNTQLSKENALSSHKNENIFMVNRADMNIKAKPEEIWSYLPGIRVKEGMTYTPLNDLRNQKGAEYLLITKNEKGEVTKTDQFELLHYELGVRFVAKITYLPPMPAFNIFYNVELTDNGDGSTRFVMDSYTWVNTKTLLGTNTIDLKTKVALHKQSQGFIDKSYNLLKERIEAENP